MSTRWGNYRDYRSSASHFPGFSPSTHVPDLRLDLLVQQIPDLFAGKHCLDIGCNSGAVSSYLAFGCAAASVTGVDIDPHLVRQASKLVALRSSRVRPSGHDAPVVDYFPMSAVLQHGYRFEPHPKPSHSPASLSSWPRVSFFSGDWVLSTDPALSGPFNVILALSVIKWIHLEHLDQGLLAFFRKCSLALVAGGYLIIELQPWDSYQKAVRPNTAPHYRANFDKLRIRPETSFDGLLEEHDLHLFNTSETLPRRISVYKKGKE